MKKLNNAEVIRTMLEIEKKCIANGEEEIFTEKFRGTMEEVLKEATMPDGTQNDTLANALLQKKLKAVPKINVK